jgi:ABC-2 type transport system permease protein
VIGWRGFAKLTWVEMKLFARDPFAMIFALVFPLVLLLLLAAVFGDTPTTDVVDGVPIFRGVGGAEYYVAASIGLVIAALGLFSLPTHLAAYREQGVLKRLRASSVPAWALFGSQLAVGLVVALLGAALMTAAAAVLYGTGFPAAPGGVIVAGLLATLAFTALGLLLASLLKTARAAQGISLLLFLVSWMLAGAGPPRAVLPDTVRTISEAIPLTHVVIAIQDPWFGYGWSGSHLLITAIVAVAAAVPAIGLFRWD